MVKPTDEVEDRVAACAAAIDQIHEIVGTGKFHRGDVVAMLAAILTDVLKPGPAEARELLVESMMTRMRRLWAEADAREAAKADEPPVM